MRVTNNIHNVAALDDAELVQKWTEEEKIPVKASPVSPPPKKEEEKKEGAAEGAEEKPAEAAQPEPTAAAAQPEQKFETKIKNKESYVKLKFQTSNFALAPKLRKDFFDAEEAMTKADRDILDAKDVKNQLETYCYDMRSKVDAYGNLEKNIDDATKATFIAEINECVEWLYDAGEKTALEEYKKRLDHFKAIGEPVKQRNFYWGELPSMEKELEKATEVIQQKLSDPALAHLTDEQRDNVLKKHQATNDFFAKVREDRAAKSDAQDPGFKLTDISAMLNSLKTETNAIFATPPPKPKTPPKEKEEDAKMEAPDAPTDEKKEG